MCDFIGPDVLHSRYKVPAAEVMTEEEKQEVVDRVNAALAETVHGFWSERPGLQARWIDHREQQKEEQ